MRDAGRLQGLDTLRTVAIVGVMLFHLGWAFPPWLGPVRQFGWMGVDLFFVLSGFLIGAQLLRAPGSGGGVWEFYRRRLYRILPAYLVVLAIYFLVPVWREEPGLSPLWEFLTFTENLFVDYGTNQAFSHVWSLCIEEQFYLALPVIVLVMMRRPSFDRTLWLLGALVAVGIAGRAFVLFYVLRPLGVDGVGPKYIELIYYPTWSRMDGLLAGVALALVRLHRPTWWSGLAQRGHATLVGGAGLIAVAMWLFRDRLTSQTGAAMWGTMVGFPVLSAGLGLVGASAMSERGWLARVPLPGAQWVATLAYSLYLSHKGVAHLARTYLPGLTEEGRWTVMATDAVLCLAAAWLLHWTVERPFLRLRDRKATASAP